MIAATRPAADDPARQVWDLVERAQAGDRDAFGDLYDRYVDTVFRYIFYKVHGDHQLAEDLTADTFLRAMKSIASVTWQGKDIGAWLVTIARNITLDYFKNWRYRLEQATVEIWSPDGTAYATEPAAVDDPAGEVVTRMDEDETRTVLRDGILRLTDRHRECLTLRFVQGFSVAETASVMGCNEGAVKALQFRAIRQLRRNLPEGFGTP